MPRAQQPRPCTSSTAAHGTQQRVIQHGLRIEFLEQAQAVHAGAGVAGTETISAETGATLSVTTADASKVPALTSSQADEHKPRAAADLSLESNDFISSSMFNKTDRWLKSG